MEYILLIVLLGLSFFFSGTETAVTAVSASQVYDLEKKGNKNAGKLMHLKNKPATLLGTLLFGNNVVNIALTALSTALMIDLLGDKYGVLVATFGVSFAVLVFSEILPKTYAFHNALSFSLKTVPVLSVLVVILSPVVKGLNALSKIMMKFLPKNANKSITYDEIKSEIRGTLLMTQNDNCSLDDSQESGMVKSVLDLSDVAIDDVMCHRSKMVSLNIDLPVTEIFDFVASSPFSRIPLWQNNPSNIVGVLHAKSLLKVMNTYYQTGQEIDLLSYSAKPWVVLNTTSLLHQLHAFKKRREHFALVVDEYGAIEGLITLEDILEEIVGDIADESDSIETAQLQIKKTDKNTYTLDGATTIRDINRHFKWDISDEFAPTIAGYILYIAERIPNEGDTFTQNNFTYTILKKTKNRLATIQIKKIK